MQPALSRMCSSQLSAVGLCKRGFYKSSPRLTNPAAFIERQERIKLNNENDINATLSESSRPSVAAVAVQPGSTAAKLLDSLSVGKAADVKVAAMEEAAPVATTLDRDSPLPFDEVPGPAVLKLWEKYWRYVPLLGTQLFRSLLINKLTEGRLFWNRNVTPLRYLFNEYGPVVRLNGPFSGNIVLIHRPEHISKVFDEEGDSPARSGIDVLQHYRLNYRKYRFAGPFCAQGSQIAEWLETKKALEAPVTEQISKQFGKLEMACDELILRIRQIKNRQAEVPNNFSQELSRWGLESFWILMLGKKMGYLDSTGYNENSEASRFIEALQSAHLYMSRCETGFQVWRFFDTPFSKRLFNSCDIIDGIIGKYIRMVQNNMRGDLVLTSEGEKPIQINILENLLVKQRMNPDDISTILMDMVILGVQATVNSQAFLLYYLAKNPRIQNNLHKEIMSKVQDNPIVSRKTLEEMPYLNACIKECFRLNPPFPYLTRLLSKNITLHGYEIPKGTYLIMANQISSQREENFEDPEKFKVERWLNDNENSCPKNGYMPFGKGFRSCMGQNMAKLEMMLLTTKIIQEFRIEYDYADIKSSFYMMNVPNRPLRFRFVDRD